MFDFEEKSSGCPKCGHVMQDGVCLWCNAPKIQDTRPKVMSRRSDPSTSKRAAQKAKYRTGTHKDLLLRAYGRNPAGLTDEEAGDEAGMPYHAAAWKRCADLRNDGMIAPLDGVERPGRSGSAMRVCALTDLGFATLRTMKEHHAHQPDPVPVPTHGSHPAGYCGRRDCLICESDPFSEDAR
jgi:hypothetical protein